MPSIPELRRDCVDEDTTCGNSSSSSPRDGKTWEILRKVRMDSVPDRELGAYRRWVSGSDFSGRIIAFVNSESGSGVGHAIMDEFKKLDCQVCDLADPLEPHLLLSELVGPTRFIVCGGDGTVTWILKELEKSGAQGPCGIVPLGTGNDLARSLGWGSHLRHISDLPHYLRLFAEADEVPLDSWRLTLTSDEALPVDHKFHTPGSHPRPIEGDPLTFVGYFQNYFSVGLDARITYHVEQSRRTGHCGRALFKRGLGKFVYAWKGASQSILGACCERLLTPYVHLGDLEPLDDRRIHSCVLKGRCRQISVININSYAGGQKVFHGRQEPGDGLLEVLAVRSCWFGLGVIGGCNSMHYVDSVPKMELRFTAPAYMQIDGESWYMPSSCTVTIEHHRTVSMLRAPADAFWTAAHPSSFWSSVDSDAESPGEEEEGVAAHPLSGMDDDDASPHGGENAVSSQANSIEPSAGG